MLRAAVQTYYTVVFYNTVTRVLKWLGAGGFFEWLTPRIETAYARLSGNAPLLQHGWRTAPRRPWRHSHHPLRPA